MPGAIEFVTVKISTENAAFDDSPTAEIARILRSLADRFEQDGLPPQRLRDSNGNTCGECQILREGE